MLVCLHAGHTDTLKQHLCKTDSPDVPIDCCLRICCSSSSSSLGSSLGGRMPFLLRMSFHSVSAFGSWIKRKKRTHVTISENSAWVCFWGPFGFKRQSSVFWCVIFYWFQRHLMHTIGRAGVTLKQTLISVKTKTELTEVQLRNFKVLKTPLE